MDPITVALGLAQFAPTIMRFFGAGEKSVAVAEQIGQTAQMVTGAKSPAEALEMIKANQQMQMAFQEKILETDADLEKAYLADRADARARDKTFIEHGMSNVRANWLAFAATGALVGVIFLLFFRTQELPATSRDILMILLGTLIAIVKDVYAFEFGSTRDSKNKTDAIVSIAKGNQ